MNLLLVFLGGGLGSMSRYGISLWLQYGNWKNFPLATLISNLLACLLLALLVYSLKERSIQNPWLIPFLATGFCGGFSTFSTFSYETFQLIAMGNWIWAVLNVLISITFGIGIFYFFREV